jgi:hypothetical protein
VQRLVLRNYRRFSLISLEFASRAGPVLHMSQYIFNIPGTRPALPQSPGKMPVRMLPRGLVFDYFHSSRELKLPGFTRFHFRAGRDLLLHGVQ